MAEHAENDEYEEFDKPEAQEYEEEEEEEDEEILLAECRGGARGRGAASRGGRGMGGKLHRFIDDGDEEDEGTDDDEKADRDAGLLQDACLPVSGPPMAPGDGPPQDADEYLRQVQWERLRCPETLEADVEERPPREGRGRRGGSYLARWGGASSQDNERGDAFCSEWAEDVLEAFGEIQARSEEARRQTPPGRKQRLTFVQWREHCGKSRPSSAFLAKQNFVSIGRLVTVAIENFVDAEEERNISADAESADAPEECEAPAETSEAGAGRTSKSGPLHADLRRLDRLAEWVFAACSFVEQPLLDDIQFQMQRLRRSCLRLLTSARSSDQEASPAQDQVLSRASLLLVIVTRVFGQR